MVVSFDGMITYVNAGWEGSSHDLPVLQHSIVEPQFDFPHPSPGTPVCWCNMCSVLSPIMWSSLNDMLSICAQGSTIWWTPHIQIRLGT